MATHLSTNEEMIGTADPSYAFGRFVFHVNANGWSLTSGGRAISLSTAEATVLRALLEHHGEFVRTDELLKLVSPSPMASENLVHGAVRGLRRTLNDAELIKNERSRGYLFTGPMVRRDGTETSSVPVLGSADPILHSNSAGDPSGTKRDPFVVVALLVTLPVVLLPFGLLLFGGNWETLPRQIGFIQALMILVAIAYDSYFSEPLPSEDAVIEVRRARLAVQQLRRFWRLLLVCWACLYLTLPFSQWLAPVSGPPVWQWQAIQVVATFLNNASALMLVLCYVVLNRPTVVRVADREIERVPLRAGLLIIGGVGLIEALLLALFDIYGLSAYYADVLFAFDLLSGVVGGIAMALCISRLDSRLLGSKGLLPIIPIVLYLYVVIQPFYPLINRTFPNRFGLTQHFDLWIIQLAFMLKAIMYIYVTDLFRTRRFLFYMIHARRIYENADSEWGSFKAGDS